MRNFKQIGDMFIASMYVTKNSIESAARAGRLRFCSLQNYEFTAGARRKKVQPPLWSGPTNGRADNSATWGLNGTFLIEF